MEGWSRKRKRLMDTESSVVIAGGINSNGKNTIKIKLKQKFFFAQL